MMISPSPGQLKDFISKGQPYLSYNKLLSKTLVKLKLCMFYIMFSGYSHGLVYINGVCNYMLIQNFFKELSFLGNLTIINSRRIPQNTLSYTITSIFGDFYNASTKLLPLHFTVNRLLSGQPYQFVCHSKVHNNNSDAHDSSSW